MDVRAIGLVVLSLGGGRTRADQSIDYAVGLSSVAGLGEEVGPERPLALVHAWNLTDAEQAAAAYKNAVTLAEDRPAPAPIIHGRLSGETG